MQVIKGDGSVVAFDASKVIKSIRRTGATEDVAQAVLSRVKPRLHDKMTTKALYTIVHEELKKESVCYSCRYSLRDAILKFGPAGYAFEKYAAAILRAYQYEAFNPREDIAGMCTRHEVDVIAEKDGRPIFIEAKFRNDPRDFVDLKDIMATWARFLDLVDGAAVHSDTPHFDMCWVVTNARFSDRALEFGTCKGMRLVGWGHPKEMSFQQMVDHVYLYPITVIDDLSQQELEQLIKVNLMLCKDVAEQDAHDLAERLDISAKRAETLIQMCQEIVEEGE